MLRMKGPDIDNWMKLGQVMVYLQKIIGLPLKRLVHTSRKIRWYIDTPYTLHNDMKSQNGGTNNNEQVQYSENCVDRNLWERAQQKCRSFALTTELIKYYGQYFYFYHNRDTKSSIEQY